MQGYLFSPALPTGELSRFFQSPQPIDSAAA
jgi:hypothetical protein